DQESDRRRPSCLRRRRHRERHRRRAGLLRFARHAARARVQRAGRAAQRERCRLGLTDEAADAYERTVDVVVGERSAGGAPDLTMAAIAGGLGVALSAVGIAFDAKGLAFMAGVVGILLLRFNADRWVKKTEKITEPKRVRVSAAGVAVEGK